MTQTKKVRPARFWLNIAENEFVIFDTRNNMSFKTIDRTPDNFMEAVDLLKELNEREKLEKEQLEDAFFTALEQIERDAMPDADLEADSFMYADDQEFRGEL